MDTQVTSALPAVFVDQTRVIKATRAAVFRAWTEPALLKLWFGAPRMQCVAASADVRLGGAYSLEIHAPPGAVSLTGAAQASVTGQYTKIIPNELLQFTWLPSWSEGEESLVTISLRDVAAGTELNLHHDRFLSEASGQGHNDGWAAALDKFVEVAQAQG